MITYEPGMDQNATLFCKKMQFLFVAHALKTTWPTLVPLNIMEVVRVDKTNWNTAFATLSDSDEARHELDTEPVATDIQSDSLGNDIVMSDTTAMISDRPTARKGRKTKIVAEIVTTQLRRSDWANKYNGFKAPSLAETRTTQS